MAEFHVKIKRRVYNKAYLPYRGAFDPLEIFYGGAGSGKSVFVAQRFVERMIKYPWYNVIAIRKTSAENHDSTFALICQIINKWNLYQLFTINRSKGDEKITCLNGSEMLFKGAKDERELEKLKSVTFQNGVVNHIWLEEATGLLENDYDQIELRLRGTSRYKKQITMTFNPIRETHWIKKRFFDRHIDNIAKIKTTYKDNRFLTEEDIKRIEGKKEVNPLYYQIYGLGDWGQIEGVVFTNYTIKKCSQDDEWYDDIDQGMDFGFEHPSVFIRIGWKDGKPYIFQEVSRRHKTNTEYINEVERKYGEALNKVKKKTTIADSAEPARIKDWKQKGWNIIPSRKGRDSYGYGIDYLKSHELIIDPSCVRMIEEVQGFSKKKDGNGNWIDDYVRIDDDAIAACRYATEMRWNKSYIRVSEVSAGRLGL